LKTRNYNTKLNHNFENDVIKGQGRDEGRWRPGQDASFAPPYSNLRPSGSKCTVLKIVLVTSGVTRGLSQGAKFSWRGPLATCQHLEKS